MGWIESKVIRECAPDRDPPDMLIGRQAYACEHAPEPSLIQRPGASPCPARGSRRSAGAWRPLTLPPNDALSPTPSDSHTCGRKNWLSPKETATAAGRQFPSRFPNDHEN